MKICPDNICTGCGACTNACRHDCITLEEDKYGELHPKIDEQKCVGCGLCAKACPNNSPLDFLYPKQCYASWIKDVEKRRICASGGIATIMSEYAIRHRNGVVFGTAYDENLVPRTTSAENVNELESFKGSKYVQSIVSNDVFRQIRKLLTDGRFVLYIATPCQIAGLKIFLRKDFDNLITVDLICHGVCPTKYFTDELAYLKSEYKVGKLTDVRFRGNDGNNYVFTLWDGGKRLYSGGICQNYYLMGFIWGVTLRENCYSCRYARPERISDITIGDFIGLGKNVPFTHSANNVSSVLVNTEKGVGFYAALSAELKELVNVEREYGERLEYRPSLMEPFTRHPLNAEFRQIVATEGYNSAVRSVMRGEMLKLRVKGKAKSLLTLPYRAARKIYRILFKKI